MLLPFAGDLLAADTALVPRLLPPTIGEIVDLIPDEWLRDEPQFATPDEHRRAYRDYLVSRLAAPRAFVSEAISAHR